MKNDKLNSRRRNDKLELALLAAMSGLLIMIVIIVVHSVSFRDAGPKPYSQKDMNGAIRHQAREMVKDIGADDELKMEDVNLLKK